MVPSVKGCNFKKVANRSNLILNYTLDLKSAKPELKWELNSLTG
jgi:hypothetical protein